jgi:fatty acid-binding protein DegV
VSALVRGGTVDAAILAISERMNVAILASFKEGDPRFHLLARLRRQFVEAMVAANLKLAAELRAELMAEHEVPAALPEQLEAAPSEELPDSGAAKHHIAQHTLH